MAAVQGIPSQDMIGAFRGRGLPNLVTTSRNSGNPEAVEKTANLADCCPRQARGQNLRRIWRLHKILIGGHGFRICAI